MASEAEGTDHENNDNLFSNTGGSRNTGNNRNRMYDASEGLFDDNNDGLDILRIIQTIIGIIQKEEIMRMILEMKVKKRISYSKAFRI